MNLADFRTILIAFSEDDEERRISEGGSKSLVTRTESYPRVEHRFTCRGVTASRLSWRGVAGCGAGWRGGGLRALGSGRGPALSSSSYQSSYRWATAADDVLILEIQS